MADIDNPRNTDNVARSPGAFGVGATNAGPGKIDPDIEDRYWRANFATRPYVQADRGYEFYRPAYRHGWESRARFHNRRWEDVEPELRRHWEERTTGPHEESATHKAKDTAVGMWDEMKHAVKDAWDHAVHH
jgi:hypothetical protein